MRKSLKPKEKEHPMKTRYFLSMALMVVCGASLCARAASTTDDRIESSAKNSYNFKHYLKHDSIKIHSKDGAVTLTGKVSEGYHKTLAEETVSSLPGVVSVDDRLMIKGHQPAENSDAWIEAKVKTALLFHGNVSALTHVSVTAGVVTLSGKADNDAQRELTAEYAKDVEGVRDVRNDMTVEGSKKAKETMGQDIDDASITAQVKVALLSHHSTSAIDTRVTTTKGVVTVSGKADNAAEKDLVTKIVTDIDGVRGVVNNMSL